MSRLWRACEHPERPPDPYVAWCEIECRACALKLEVALNPLDPLNPDHEQDIRACHRLLDRVAPASTVPGDLFA